MACLRLKLFRFFLACLFFCAWPAGLAAQNSFRDVIEMSVEVGFDSFFRLGDWTPVRVALKNNGESVTGRLVVRPETSGTVVGNAFSTPIALPNGSEKSALLNIQVQRHYPDRIRVELIDDAGTVRAARDAGLYDLPPQAQLYAVVTGPNTAPPSLSGLHVGGSEAEQAHWSVSDIPENSQALQSLDLLLLLDFDSESLSNGQRRAIRHWVEGGGHLLVGGGPSALNTSAALVDLLPFIPNDSQTIDDLSALARFSGDDATLLRQRAIIAQGALQADAQVLVAQGDSPLLMRRYLGAGLVDFLAADPMLEPLASWPGLSQLWLKLVATRAPQPAWRAGFRQPELGAEAVANLPGVDLLPPIQTLCLFLALYIVLIGPLNYLILSRLRRNGWGWFTIPLVIIGFTAIAWTVGFNLRGTQIIVSRLTLVESYSDSDEAQLNQYIGLLSPRRATYSLAVPEGRFLGVSRATISSSFFASNAIQTATEISQGARFGAYDFTIDGGIFANFTASGRLPKPAIGGSFTLDFEVLESGRLVSAYQGALSNNSDIVLRDAVLLGPGLEYRLPSDFAPGDILTLGREELQAGIADYPTQPNPLELQLPSSSQNLSPFSSGDRNISIKDLQGPRYLRARALGRVESIAEKQAAREQSFLASFMIDQFGSSARGSGLYLLGWSDSWLRDLEISGAGFSTIDTTLYIIALDVDIKLPRETVTLASEHFTWLTIERVGGLRDNGTDGFSLYEEQGVEFLFHPLPHLELDTVDFMLVEVDRSGGYAQVLDIELYNWQNGDYDSFTYRDGDELEFSNPQPYLGPGKSLRLRLQFGGGLGTARVRKIRLEQTGRY